MPTLEARRPEPVVPEPVRQPVVPRFAPERPPRGASTRELPDGGWEVRLRWYSLIGPMVHALWLFIPLPLLVGPSLLGLVLTTGMFAIWVAFTFNTTTVSIFRDHVRVDHGPVPDPFNFRGTLRAEELRGLTIDERSETRRVGYSRSFAEERWHSLRAGDVDLLRFWLDGEHVAFVHDCILGIVDRNSVSEPVRAPSPLLPDGTPPRGVEVDVLPDGVELVMPWSAHHGTAAVHLLWLIILPALLSGGLSAVIGLGVAAFWAYMVFNRTTVFVGEDGRVDVEHGPLPNPFTPDVHFRNAPRDISVDDRIWDPTGFSRYEYRTFKHYRLSAGGKEVMAYWMDPNKVRYVAEVLRRNAR